MSILESFGSTPEHNLAIANMDKNFRGNQFDYAAASTKDMVDRASNPFTATVSAAGNVLGRPAYDFVDAAQKYSDKGYQGEFSFSPQGAVDFGKNLGAFGEEFLAQKPGVMMAGALKGGIESLGTQLGESIYDKFHPSYEEDDEYDFSGIEGQTAGLGVLTGLKKIFGPKVGAYLFKTGKHKALNKIGKKVKPIITGAITGGAAAAGPSGGGQWVGGSPAYTHQGQGGGEFIDTQGNVDYHDPYDSGGGEAQGGFIDGTNRRRSYFDGGLLSLWPR